jgi:anti-anti-sigma factor
MPSSYLSRWQRRWICSSFHRVVFFQLDVVQKEGIMIASADVFEIDLEGRTLIVTPARDLRELEFEQIEAETAEVLRLVDAGTIRNVVVDLYQTDYCGSTALGLIVKLWKRVRQKGGRMALCNLSEHEREIFAMAKLDSLWPICCSREEALMAVAPGNLPA